MTNSTPCTILTAFSNIVKNPHASINPAKLSRNRITHVADALEGYIKDALVGLLGVDSVSEIERTKRYSQALSWLGNSSNPPDCILKDGDALEIKKIQNLYADIALNSSHPKHKLYADDSRVSSAAKAAESWIEKDIVYAIGSTSDSLGLQRLWFLYGDCFAASREVYEKLSDAISMGVNHIPSVEFEKTNEIGRVNKVDPLGITKMRIRGMWHITNPSLLYKQFVQKTPNKQFYLLMREEKYQSFSTDQKACIETLRQPGFANETVEIRDPDNPARLLNARLIKYEI